MIEVADSSEPMAVAVVDDHAVVHAGIAGWCAAADPPIQLVGNYPTPAAFLADPAVTPDTVSAVVLDLQFGEHTVDLSAPALLCERGFRVVIFSQHIRSTVVLDCLDLGAVTYLSKLEGEDHLVAALHAAGADRPYLSPTMAQAMTDDTRPSRPVLSPREREVLLAWFQTESKALVGQRLFITTGTVNTHLERIRTKYAQAGRPASTKAALVARAIQDGLVDPDEL
ncbi:LuxR family two component transcriptional regulator [Nocardia alba]|uniref:LuxR family two component transcriptional regulator n=2 Tax=Nocardia alba TaxID=225051 RepID=A0A4R1FQ44_9NOCA|nr:LuxR family two component transcriptional regulator [Nocardia alba]